MDPRSRVMAFLTDFRDAWTRFHPTTRDRMDFAAWGRVVRDLDARHFVPGAGCGAGGSEAVLGLCLFLGGGARWL